MDLLLSIVTVSLDAEATIERTLASVTLQQVNFGVEHICVDGGSATTLGQLSIAGRCAIRESYPFMSPTKDLRRDEQGPGAASGEYVLFLNADDFLVARDTLASR